MGIKNRIKGYVEIYGIYILLGAVILLGMWVSIFRDTVADENIYLRETMVMSDLLGKGEWFGNHAVGVHGFLFKLPVALLFLVTGPSIFAATVFHVFLSVCMCWILYRMLGKHPGLKGWALVGTFLFAAGFDFIKMTPTYYREIPVTFALLVFIYVIVSGKSKILAGLALLLILDAKEYVFFMVAPAYLVWIFIRGYLLREKKGWMDVVKEIGILLVTGFLPSLLYLILMFCTGVIPVNMFLAVILGLVEKGMAWNASHFSLESATANRISGNAEEIAGFSALAVSRNFPSALVTVVDALIAYFGKLIYPRSFSFISIPKIVIVPSFFMSIRKAGDWLKAKKINLLILPLVMWSFLFIFIMRASYGRYLFPLSFVAVIFFLSFLAEGLTDRKFFLKVFWVTIFFAICGMFFEEDFVMIKILLNVLLFAGLYICSVLHQRDSRSGEMFSRSFVFILGCVMSVVAVYFLILNGQVSRAVKWGRYRECGDVMSQFEVDDIVWINDFGWDQLPLFFREDMENEPEWKWALKPGIPKKEILYNPGDNSTYYFKWEDIALFQKEVAARSINKVGFVRSTIPESLISDHGQLEILKEQDWLNLIDVVELQNKELYIFESTLLTGYNSLDSQ